MPRLLVVDDDTVTCRLLADVFKRDGYTVIGETDPRRALARVTDEPVDLAILDVQMPEMDGLALLRGLRERLPGLPVVIMTAFGSIDTAVQAIASGAVDYLSKPMDVEEIRATVRKALGRSAEAQASLPVAGEELGGVVGRSPAMVEVYKTIARVAPARSTVLILGESGTGKELVARAVHERSPRSAQAFVPIHCGALPREVLESELFGHEKGAFTGAVNAKPGLIELAEGGTLFLDEIGEMEPESQVKLLRVLESLSFFRVGGTRRRTVDMRLVVATNRDLGEAIKANQFRQDLYYRINTITVSLPPLRERREDIRLLAEHFLEQNAVYGRKRLSPVALRVLERCDWPGNVRELQHAIQRAVILCTGDEIQPEDLPTEVRSGDAAAGPASGSLEEIERQHIITTLKQVGGHRAKAAALLRIDPKTLYRKILTYGISPDQLKA